MTKSVTFPITSGLPFAKIFIVTLPAGRSWWTTTADFEVRAQVREKPEVTSTLVLDFLPYLEYTIDGDVITISLSMTGEDTNKLSRSGYYDIILSDVGTVDSLAFKILQGPVKRNLLVTAP